MFPDIGHIYGGPSLSIKKKEKEKEKNNKKQWKNTWNKNFQKFTLYKKNGIKDVYWAVTTKMTTST